MNKQKFFLTSSTITENLVSDFEIFTHRSITGMSCAFITDAFYGFTSNDPEYLENDRADLYGYGWKLTDVRLLEYLGKSFDSLSDFDVLYVNGGASGYLANVMHKTGFDSWLVNYMNNGGIYVGSSGGSMVLSDSQDAAIWYIGEAEPFAATVRGLGYFSWQIYPHYEEVLLPEIERLRDRSLEYVLLRNGQAVAFDGQERTFYGGHVDVLPAVC